MKTSRQIEFGDRIKTLRAAIRNNPAAQQAILEHFSDYINTMSAVTLCGEDGRRRTYLDDDIRIQIQSALLSAILRFDLEGILRQPRQMQKKARCIPQETASQISM
ncbi:MAG: helix-turn-helix domain-containing protein [Christensenellaceae bacterium]|nr:helix-turn-helix domain-containing protein [Christensenellaceae bacterium]